MKEIFKDIEGYENLYQVSNTGKIKSLLNNKNQIMKQSIHSCGYYKITLLKDKKYHTKYVHRLVAIAFVPNPDNKSQVNHIDGNKLNNNVSNLEWVTPSENQLHAIKLHLREPSPMTNKKGILNHNSKPIIQLTLDGRFVKCWDCISDAAKYYGVNPTNISNAVCGRHKTSNGFLWRYIIKHSNISN